MTKEEKSWILYDVANSAYSLIITATIFPIFFKNFAAKGMEGYDSTAWLGYGNSIYTFAIAFLAPFLGTMGDYRGKKKNFFLFFVILAVVSTLSFSFITEGAWIHAIVLYVISALGFAGANIFYDSFLIDVTVEERLDWISTNGYAWGYIGSVIPFIIGIVFILHYDKIGLEGPLNAMYLTFIITGVWWALFTIPLLRNVKQKYFIEPSSKPIRYSFNRLTNTVKDIRKYKNAFIFLLAYFFYIDGVDTIIKMAVAFGTDLGIDANTLIIILLVVQIIAFPCALIYGRLSKIISAKKMLLVGIGIYIIITITAYFIPWFSSVSIRITLFWVLSILVATSQGGIQALSRSLYGKLIPKEKSAEFFGFYNIFGKFAAIIGPFLMGIISQITQNTSFGLLSIIILFIIGGFFLLKVKEVRGEHELL
ncbi:MAG: MFS transporter [Spirochaetota bacterium]|nr:MFS transporter [Spirochaetota bacterium]